MVNLNILSVTCVVDCDVSSWSPTQEVAGSVTEFNEFSENILGKLKCVSFSMFWLAHFTKYKFIL